MSDLVAERYRLLNHLGQGGMGRVWRARDELLGRDVALKELVLPPGPHGGELGELRERAIREARAIARIDHPNVVRIHDVVHAAGVPWIVMEWVPSRSLHEVISEDGPVPPERVAGIGLAVLDGLRAAHRAGVLHRDVKPANVLLGHGGRVVLTDFGLAAATGDAAMTDTGIVVGSPSYLAPERALDQPIGPAADLWSLGATLYAAVEGRPPYDRSTPIATLAALATEPPRPPDRAGVLRPALDGLLRKDPAGRVDADEAERLLADAAAGKAPAPARRPRRWWIPVAAVLIVAAGFVARPVFSPAQAEEAVIRVAVSPPPKPTPSTTTRPTKPATRKPTPAVVKSVTGRSIENLQTGACLQLESATGAIQLSACTGAVAQKFSFRSDGTLRVLGRCVQIEGTGNGARLAAAACSGSAGQQFRYNDASDLVSGQVDKCVDVPDGNAADGVLAQIWDCSGNGNQKWRY